MRVHDVDEGALPRATSHPHTHPATATSKLTEPPTDQP